MTNYLKCPHCGNDEFDQTRSMIYDEYIVAKFNSHGHVEDEIIEESECSGEDSAGPYECKQCGWQLVNGNGEEITEPTDVVAAFVQAHQAQAKGSKAEDPMPHSAEPSDSGWHHVGSVTIDTGRLLLLDPVHQGRVDPGAGDGQIAIPGGDLSAVQVPTGIGDGRYRVEARGIDSPIFGKRIAEIRVRFLDEEGNWLGGDTQ